MLILLALACSPATEAQAPVTPAVDAPDVVEPAEPASSAATWTIAVWMDGDNNLEEYVTTDLDELERAATTAGYRVVVQADRRPGFSADDGDWTGTRRYEVVPDVGPGVDSPVVEDLGERDMGDPAELSEFLLWAHDRVATDHLAVVLWNHGGGSWIASDDTSQSKMGVNGELQAALQPVIDARGAPVDILAFDACNMAEWELAHAMAPQVNVLVASQAWLGGAGFAYDKALKNAPADLDAVTLGDRLAWTAGVYNRQNTMSAVDLTAEPAVAEAIHHLATAWLAEPERLADWARARIEAQRMDPDYPFWWRDLDGFAAAAETSPYPDVAAAGAEVRAALSDAVISSYGKLGIGTGLSIFADLSEDSWIEDYQRGSWSQDTRWGELLAAARAARPGG
jgi:hypothetical protein